MARTISDLAGAHNISLSELKPHLYHYLGSQAVQHLLEVSSGLDSLVLGEPQILGQVTHALQLARGQNTVGHILSRLFQNAIRTGKRARTETLISHNPASVSSLAASLAEKKVSSIDQAQITVVGAGKMAELAVEALRKRGAERILVVNRTLERALSLGQKWDAELATFEQLESAIERADILIASTGAPHTLIDASMVESIMQKRPERPLVMIDIAVPRDIDAMAGNIENISLYDMDGLHVQLEDSLSKRSAEVPQVEEIIAEQKALFDAFLASLDMLPLINDLKKQAEEIRQMELQKTLRRMPNLGSQERKRIEILTQALVKKLIDAPAANLRQVSSDTHAVCYAKATRVLFNMDKNTALPCLEERPQ
ncbi:MAG: glutamyl-tRNA reductase [Chloroflexi bacterium]|nr:glutamyl-tRNA reductase [Chloroflexota bacterium]